MQHSDASQVVHTLKKILLTYVRFSQEFGPEVINVL